MRDKLADLIVRASHAASNRIQGEWLALRVAYAGAWLADAITRPMTDSEWSRIRDSRPTLLKLYSRGVISEREAARAIRAGW